MILASDENAVQVTCSASDMYHHEHFSSCHYVCIQYNAKTSKSDMLSQKMHGSDFVLDSSSHLYWSVASLAAVFVCHRKVEKFSKCNCDKQRIGSCYPYLSYCPWVGFFSVNQGTTRCMSNSLRAIPFKNVGEGWT